MKKSIILLVVLMASVMASNLRAASYATGITPYIFWSAYDQLVAGNDARATRILTNSTAGYKVVGTYNDPIGSHTIYSRGAILKVNRQGDVVSASGVGYSSYIEIGTTVGLDCFGSITFLTNAGANAFIQVLKKAGYRKLSNVWEKGDGRYFIQSGRKFSVSEGYR